MPPALCVYLLESRRHRRGLRTHADHWQAEGVFTSEREALAWAGRHRGYFFHGWRVTAVPVVGGESQTQCERQASMCIKVVNCKGLKTPEQRAGVAYVGRAFAGWPRHSLCNPANLNAYASREQCLANYREHLAKMPDLEERLAALWEECRHGALPLGCWCTAATAGDGSPVVCHAQQLAELLRDRFVDPDCEHLEHRGDGHGNWRCADCGLFMGKLNLPDVPQCAKPAAGKGGGL